MGIYIGLFFLTALCSFVEFFKIEDKKKKGIIISLAILYIFISGLRWNNPDWMVYYPFFLKNNTLDDFWGEGVLIERGFGFINFLVKSFTDEYTVLLFLLAIIIIGIKVNFIIKFSLYPLISLLYWFGTYIGDIFFIRQTLAIAVTLIAFKFIVKRKFLWFLLFTFIATNIQISSILFICAYYIFHKRIRGEYLFFEIMVCIFLGRLLDTSLLLMVGNVLDILPFNTERLMNKIAFYYSVGLSDGDFLLWGYIRRLFFLPLEIWAIRKMEKFDQNFRGCTNLVVVGYMFYFLLGNVSPTVASRISSVFYIYEILTIPALFILFKSIYYKIILFFILLIYSFIKYTYAINLYEDAYIPYMNVLF